MCVLEQTSSGDTSELNPLVLVFPSNGVPGLFIDLHISPRGHATQLPEAVGLWRPSDQFFVCLLCLPCFVLRIHYRQECCAGRVVTLAGSCPESGLWSFPEKREPCWQCSHCSWCFLLTQPDCLCSTVSQLLGNWMGLTDVTTEHAMVTLGFLL